MSGNLGCFLSGQRTLGEAYQRGPNGPSRGTSPTCGSAQASSDRIAHAEHRSISRRNLLIERDRRAVLAKARPCGTSARGMDEVDISQSRGRLWGRDFGLSGGRFPGLAWLPRSPFRDRLARIGHVVEQFRQALAGRARTLGQFGHLGEAQLGIGKRQPTLRLRAGGNKVIELCLVADLHAAAIEQVELAIERPQADFQIRQDRAAGSGAYRLESGPGDAAGARWRVMCTDGRLRGTGGVGHGVRSFNLVPSSVQSPCGRSNSSAAKNHGRESRSRHEFSRLAPTRRRSADRVGCMRLFRVSEVESILTILSRIPDSLSIIDQSRRSASRTDPHCWMVAYHDGCVQVKSRRK